MAGNPDQQEDNVDEQYQEEGEEEVRTQTQGRCRLRQQSTTPLTLNLGVF